MLEVCEMTPKIKYDGKLIGNVNVKQINKDSVIIKFTIKTTFWCRFRNLFFSKQHNTYYLKNIKWFGEWKK